MYRALDEGARLRARGVRGVRLVQVPIEGAVDDRLAAHRAQHDGERTRRQRGDQALEPQRAVERAGVARAERPVALQGALAAALARQDSAQLAPAGDAEVERGADPLAGQREAVARAVADEED